MVDAASTFLPLITLADIAEQLGVSLQTFYRNMSSLRACGFPRPVPGCGRRYDPQAVADWLARQRPANVDTAEPPTVVPPPGNLPAPEDIAGWQSELTRRLTQPPHAA